MLSLLCIKPSRFVEAAFKSGGGIDWAIMPGVSSAPSARCCGRAMRRISCKSGCRRWMAWWTNCERGARVADVGCGTGQSTFIMASEFPNSTFVGYDFHAPSIAHATAQARQNGAAGNVRFEVASAKDFPAGDLDLVTCFDVLHDLGDPVGAAAHIHRSMRPDGTWMLM